MDLLLSILSSTLWVVLALTILVFVHEFGHFITAKYFGMRVERFSVGFPPTIFGRTYGDTEYAIGATPLGGYVKISGMIDESLDTDHVETEPDPWEFRAKPVWQRIIVISAGVVFNAILALFIFAAINWSEGDTYIPAQNVEQVYVQEGSVAHELGLRTGDQIRKVNGTALKRFDQIAPSSIVAADTLTITVEREGEMRRLVGPPDIITRLSRAQNDDEPSMGAAPLPGLGYLPPLIGGVQKDSPADSLGLRGGDRILTVGQDTVRFWLEMSVLIQATEGEPASFRWRRPDSLASDTTGPMGTASIAGRTETGPIYEGKVAPRYDEERDRYLLGVRPLSPEMLQQKFGVQRVEYDPVEAFRTGLTAVWQNTRNIVVTLQRVVTGRDDLRQSLGGPVMIAKVTSDAAAAGPAVFWRIVAILSVTLAIMNILPIPALDGGQLMFLLYEAVTRRRPSVRVRLVAQQIGMILLLGFMAFLIFNDFLRL